MGTKVEINSKNKEEIGTNLSSLDENVDEVIANSIEVEEHPDYQKNERGERHRQKVNGGALMHRFYGAVAIDGKPYRMMTLMREEKRSEGMRNGIHAYEVQKIEVLDETPNTPNGTDGLNSELEASSAVAKLLLRVKTLLCRVITLKSDKYCKHSARSCTMCAKIYFGK